MSDFVSVSHHIQKHIIDVLMYAEIARFSDVCPPKINTNLFTYHLNSLVKSALVIKHEKGYTLGAAGLAAIERLSIEKDAVCPRPKIIIMLLIQNSEGDILLQRRIKQPFINTWTLPHGKVSIDDASVVAAAKRQASEKLDITQQALKHAGDCYIRVSSKGTMLSTTLAHVFTFNRDDITPSENIIWARPHKLRSLRLAPAVEEIVSRGFFNDPFFFEEFDVEWRL